MAERMAFTYAVVQPDLRTLRRSGEDDKLRERARCRKDGQTVTAPLTTRLDWQEQRLSKGSTDFCHGTGERPVVILMPGTNNAAE
jgi:hypothetical protein